MIRRALAAFSANGNPMSIDPVRRWARELNFADAAVERLVLRAVALGATTTET